MIPYVVWPDSVIISQNPWNSHWNSTRPSQIKIYSHHQCHILMCHTPQNIFFMPGPWVVGRNIFFMSGPCIVGRNIFWLKIYSETNKSLWGPSSRKKKLLFFHHWRILGNCSFVCRYFPEAVGACCLQEWAWSSVHRFSPMDQKNP